MHFDLIPEIYTIGRVTHWNANAVFLIKNFPLYSRSIWGEFVAQKKLRRYGVNNA